MESFKAFNINAVNHFIYMITANIWFCLIIIGVIGIIFLQLKDEMDSSVREEQNII